MGKEIHLVPVLSGVVDLSHRARLESVDESGKIKIKQERKRKTMSEQCRFILQCYYILYHKYYMTEGVG